MASVVMLVVGWGVIRSKCWIRDGVFLCVLCFCFFVLMGFRMVLLSCYIQYSRFFAVTIDYIFCTDVCTFLEHRRLPVVNK